MKKVKLCLCLVLIILLGICIFRENKTSFAAITGIERESIKNVKVQFRENEVVFDEKMKSEFIDFLYQSTTDGNKRSDNTPFITSDFSIILGKLYVRYVDEDPILNDGSQYLLCLYWDSLNDVYQIQAGIYGSAQIYQGKTYPRFNTEYHPFFERDIAELREIAAEML